MDLMPQIREIFTFEKVVPLEMIFCKGSVEEKLLHIEKLQNQAEVLTSKVVKTSACVDFLST